MPPGARGQVANAGTEGFLSGFNEILLLGGGLAFLGAIAALYLVRQSDLRYSIEEAEPQAAAETAAA